MASHTLPIPFPQTRKQMRARVVVRTPSLQAIAMACVALLILLYWLQFILAMGNVSTGQEIQNRTAELERIERGNAVLMLQIAEATSQENMAMRAEAMGYEPQKPLFLRLAHPLPQPSDGTQAEERTFSGNEASDQAPTQLARSWRDLLVQRLDTWLETDRTP
jgi:cell division protein FtsB